MASGERSATLAKPSGLPRRAITRGGPITGFTTSETWHGRVVVVSASGTVDIASAPQLYGAAAVAVQKKPSGFVFDFSDVDLLASAGMQVLVTTMRMLGPTVGFAVVADGPGTSRPMAIAGISDLVAVHARLDDALASIGPPDQP